MDTGEPASAEPPPVTLTRSAAQVQGHGQIDPGYGHRS